LNKVKTKHLHSPHSHGTFQIKVSCPKLYLNEPAVYEITLFISRKSLYLYSADHGDLKDFNHESYSPPMMLR